MNTSPWKSRSSLCAGRIARGFVRCVGRIGMKGVVCTNPNLWIEDSILFPLYGRHPYKAG